MNILLIKNVFVGFMVSEIPRVSVIGYFPLHVLYLIPDLLKIKLIILINFEFTLSLLNHG